MRAVAGEPNNDWMIDMPEVIGETGRFTLKNPLAKRRSVRDVTTGNGTIKCDPAVSWRLKPGKYNQRSIPVDESRQASSQAHTKAHDSMPE